MVGLPRSIWSKVIMVMVDVIVPVGDPLNQVQLELALLFRLLHQCDEFHIRGLGACMFWQG